MKIGDRVRHVGWPVDSLYGEVTELFSGDRCTVVYPDGSTYSWIPVNAVESVEAELERKRRKLAKQQVIELLESGDFAAAKANYDNGCAGWWPLAEFETRRASCIHAAQAREAKLLALQKAERKI